MDAFNQIIRVAGTVNTAGLVATALILVRILAGLIIRIVPARRLTGITRPAGILVRIIIRPMRIAIALYAAIAETILVRFAVAMPSRPALADFITVIIRVRRGRNHRLFAVIAVTRLLGVAFTIIAAIAGPVILRIAVAIIAGLAGTLVGIFIAIAWLIMVTLAVVAAIAGSVVLRIASAITTGHTRTFVRVFIPVTRTRVHRSLAADDENNVGLKILTGKSHGHK